VWTVQQRQPATMPDVKKWSMDVYNSQQSQKNQGQKLQRSQSNINQSNNDQSNDNVSKSYQWNYSDPPVNRGGKLGGNWRHLVSTHHPNGQHMMFIDGMVKQVDSQRYPPFGFNVPDTPQGYPSFPCTQHDPRKSLANASHYADAHVPMKHPQGSKSRNVVDSQMCVAAHHPNPHVQNFLSDPNAEIPNKGKGVQMGNMNFSSFNVPNFESDSGLLNRTANVDPFSAYQMGVRDGFQMSQISMTNLRQGKKGAAKLNNKVPPKNTYKPEPSTASQSSKTSTNFGDDKQKYLHKNSLHAKSIASSHSRLAGPSSTNLGIPKSTMEPYTYKTNVFK